MNLEELEGSIADRLGDLIDSDGASCVVLPEIESAFNKPVDKAQLTVAVVGHDAGDHKSIGSVVQYTRVRIEVVCKSRRLRGDWGIYDLESKVRSSLVGYRPDGGATSGLKFQQFQVNAYNDGVWSYSVFFECPATIIEDFAEYDDDTPRITEITLNENL